MKTFAESNTDYRYIKTVRFQGKVIALAAKDTNIYYRVLNLSADVPNDDDGWTSRRKLPLPEDPELRPAGRNLLTRKMKQNAFASLPFQVISDNQHIYVFRQSTQRTLYVDRFIFDGAVNVLKPTLEARYQRSQNRDVPAGKRDTMGFRNLEGKAFIEPTTELSFIQNLENGWFSVLLLPSPIPDEEHWLIFAYNSGTEAMDVHSIYRSENGLFDLSRFNRDLHTTSVRLSKFVKDEQPTPIRFKSGLSATLYMKQEDFTDEYGREQKVKRDVRVMVAIAVGSGNGQSGNEVATIDFAISQFGTPAQLRDATEIPKLRDDIARIDEKIEALEEQEKAESELKFTHQNHYVEIEYDQRLSPRPDLWSVDAWVKVEPSVTNGVIMFQGHKQKPDYFKLSIEDGRAVFSICMGDRPTDREIRAVGKKINNNQWHYLVGVRRDLKAAEIWVDGEKQGTDSNPEGISNIITTNQPLQLGRGPEPNPQPLIGLIDSVSLWRVALTKNQIEGKFPKNLGRVGEWLFNEGKGTSVIDKGKNFKGSWKRVDGTALTEEDTVDVWENAATRSRAEIEKLERQKDGLQENLKILTSGQQLILEPVEANQTLPLMYTDPNGLTVHGGLLEFAKSKSTPLLFDGHDGLLHLYFQGQKDEFFVAQYKVAAQKATYFIKIVEDHENSPNTDSGHIEFVSRWSGTFMNEAVITIESQDPTLDNGLCTVTFEVQIPDNRVVSQSQDLPLPGTADDASSRHLSNVKTITETWEGVPRNPYQFMAILNGLASQDLNDPEVISGKRVYFDYDQARAIHHLPTGEGSIRFIAREPQGTLFDDDATIEISGDDRSTCTVTLKNGIGIVETWEGVPRKPQQFVDVLSGRANPDAQNSLVQRGRDVFYSYSKREHPIYSVEAGEGILQFIAVTPSRGAIDVDISVDNPEDTTCSISLKQGRVTETWESVPRNAQHCATVLNGQAADSPTESAVQSGQQVFYDYQNERPTYLLPLDGSQGALQFVREAPERLAEIADQTGFGYGSDSNSPKIKDVSITIEDSKDEGDQIQPQDCTLTLKLTVNGAVLTERWPLLPRKIEDFLTVLSGRAVGNAYDYSKAETIGFQADLVNGSILFTVIGRELDTDFAIQNTTKAEEQRTLTVTGIQTEMSVRGSRLVSVVDDGSSTLINPLSQFQHEIRQRVTIQGDRRSQQSSNASRLFVVINQNATGQVLNHNSAGPIGETITPLPRQRVTAPLHMARPLTGKRPGKEPSLRVLGSSMFKLTSDAVFTPDTASRVELVKIQGIESTELINDQNQSVLEPDHHREHKKGEDCRWIPEPPRKAIKFEPSDSITLYESNSLNLRGDISIEAWIKPNSVDGHIKLLSYDAPDSQYYLELKNKKLSAEIRGQRVETQQPLNITSNQWIHLAAAYNSSYAVKLNGSSEQITCGNSVALDVDDVMTVEAWITPEGDSNNNVLNREQIIASRWSDTDNQSSWKLCLIDKKLRFVIRDRNSERVSDSRDRWISVGSELNAGETYHIVGIFDGSSEQVSGLEFSDKNSYLEIPHTNAFNPEGAKFSIEAWVKTQKGGCIAYKRRIGGDDHYALRIDDNGKPSFEFDPGGSFTKATSSYPIFDDRWHYICGVRRGTRIAEIWVDGIRVGVGSSGGSNTSIDTGSSLYIGTRGIGENNALIQPFQGSISEVRYWSYARTADDIRRDMSRRLTGDESGLQGYWVMNAFGDKVQDLANGYDATIKGDPITRQDSRGVFAQRLLVRQVDDDFSWTPDNRSTHGTGGTPGSRQYIANKIASSDAPILLGAQAEKEEGDRHYFKGQIHQIRLWKTRREWWELDYWNDDASSENPKEQRLTGQEEGLIGYWRFDEGRGAIAFDSKGENHGRLVGFEPEKLKQEDRNDIWLPSSINAGWTLYLDGEPIESQQDGADSNGSSGFTIGETYTGMLDDFRIWNVTRTAEEIRDNMYRPLFGSEEGLVAYWYFDETQEEKNKIHGDLEGNAELLVLDKTVNNNHAQLSRAEMLHHAYAPIGNEAPQVTNVIQLDENGGLKSSDAQSNDAHLSLSPRNSTIQGTPAVAEYGDMQYDIDGNLIGVLKRCYLFKKANGPIQMFTGYKIGDLDRKYVGQVQTQPTLIGYIEGAPPVPSENLTVNNSFRPDFYVANTSVTLLQANDTIQVYSASMDSGRDTSFSSAQGIAWDTGSETGIGLSVLTWYSEGQVGPKTTFEDGHGWLKDASIEVGSGSTVNNSLVLGGGAEDKADYDNNGVLRYLNPHIGQRFVPANVGYALVRSSTANLFSTHLKQTGALVSFQTIPNPDIPEDMNIIMFPINSKYTKNGTLDGKVGLINDPDYPGADDGQGSYFKPLEAYALRERIEREKQDTLAYFDQYDVGRKASEIAYSDKDPSTSSEYPNLRRLRDLSKEDESEGVGSVLPNKQFQDQLAQQSLVNTYVWTADGGLYAEEEEFSSTRQESLGRYFSNQGQTGFTVDIKPPSAMVGAFIEMDALFGGHLDVNVVKNQEDTSTFGLQVQVEGDGFLNQLVDPDADPENYKYLSVAAPGKVDTYRFMSFYLSPRGDSFDTFFNTVVDPNWLRDSQDANARALREARAAKNKVWRVMHRVTYVSRIPPSFDEPLAQTQDSGARKPTNIEHNHLLIEEVKQALGHARNPNPRDIGTAVDRVLDQHLVDDSETSENKSIRNNTKTYMQAYYGSLDGV